MRHLILTAAVMAASGCAGASFTGTFTGPTATTGSCSDGTSLPSTSGTITFAPTENGNTVTWMESCGATGTAHVNGNTATVSELTCPATTNNGVTSTVTITGGTLTLDGNSLMLTFVARDVLSGSTTNTCTVTTTGTLARQN